MHTFDVTLNNFSEPIVDGLNAALPKLPIILLTLLVGILLVRVLAKIIRFVLTLTTMPIGLRDVLSSLVEIALWLFLSIKLLEMLGFRDIIVFFTGSIAAIGLAMAAGGSTLIADIIAGIFLAQDVDFEVGDEVIAGETPTQGVVESMDARRIRIRDKDGILHVIPNSIVERKEWVVIRKRQDITALAKVVKTAKKKFESVAASRRGSRKNNQSQS